MSTNIPSYIKGSFIIISLRSYLGSYASIGRCGHYITYHDGHIATDLLSRPSTDVNAPWHHHRPVVLKGVHLLSIMGNAETFQRSVRQICTDTEIVYHVIYLIFCSSDRASDSAPIPSSFPSFYLTSATRRRPETAGPSFSRSHGHFGSHPSLHVLHHRVSFFSFIFILKRDWLTLVIESY